MRASQHIFRVRREYNKWVCDETLEDYSLRYTAQSHRRWSIETVAKTALGATAFLALEAIAATLTLSFGFSNTLWAMLALTVIIMVTGYPISVFAARYGLDIDLLTRSAGFGYLGSTITSLIYASFTFIFFAIEAAILASALNLLLGIPLWIGYLICAIAVIPIVTHGIATLSRFQVRSHWVWIPLQIAAILVACFHEYKEFNNWINYTPDSVKALNGSTGFNLGLFGAASAIMFAMVAQIGEQVDYLRFMPQKTQENSRRWWFWVLLAGPGWIFIGLIKMLFGSFLAYLAISRGSNFTDAADPVHMYQMVFHYLTQSQTAALIIAGVFVIVCQMKINVTNAYAGSLAWSNFFSRLTHSHPGRVVWLVFNVVIALILMELGIYRALESILSVFSIVAICWLSCIAADLLINTALGLRPEQVEFKRAYLYDINPVGVVSMTVATIVGIVCYLGYLGDTAKSLAHFIAIGICFIGVPIIATVTKGRFYIAREPEPATNQSKQVCCICENTFEGPDMALCPAYQGPICSLCCSLDTRCMDSCKPHGRFRSQLHDMLSKILPSKYLDRVDSRIGRFIATFTIISSLTALLLALIYYQMGPVELNEQVMLSDALVSLYFILLIIFGVIAWLFLLTHESREIAQQESNRQTARLIEEIEAHDVTDQELQEAKESAERANQAKSRYLTGISHELRTPLQSISGYAQLLSQQSEVNEFQTKGLTIIRRNSEYLSDLIEGLLNISKIEAGRLDLYRNHINFHEFLDQIEQMFEPSARSKGIQFSLLRGDNLPNYVTADEKRLRQILINLINNAIKYTDQGSVEVDVSYRNQVADIRVRDTGVGIDEEDLKRIMLPFERVRTTNVPNVSGTGLGLTIVRLLTEIMGGDLSFNSELGVGSEFKVSLLLFETDTEDEKPSIVEGITSYQGEQRTVLVVDDEAIHRGLISDLLQPLGFRVLEAPDASIARNMIDNSIDLFLLDISMPGENGLSLASHIRSLDTKTPIVMLSADAEEKHLQSNEEEKVYNAYIIKPMQNQALLSQITQLLKLTWVQNTSSKATAPIEIEDNTVDTNAKQAQTIEKKPAPTTITPLLLELEAQLNIGYAKGINKTMTQLSSHNWPDQNTFNDWQTFVESYQYQQLIDSIQPYLPVSDKDD